MELLYLTVVMPAYNEEANLARNTRLLAAKLAELGITYEIVIVNDASRDRTGAIADELAAADPRVRAIHHPVNQGIGGGFLTGLHAAQGAWLILIPADLALELDDLGKYLKAAAGSSGGQPDVVVGIRSDRSDYSGARLLVSWVNIRLIQVLFGMQERQFQYISMYRVAFLRRIKIVYWRSAFFHAETLIKIKTLGGRLVEVVIGYVPRASGVQTGARPGQILRTVRDIFRFWIKWIILGSVRASAG